MRCLVSKIRWSFFLEKAFRDDRYFLLYFSDGLIGRLARIMFFFDEVSMRLKHGLVFSLGQAVALVGVYPNTYISERQLSKLTCVIILLQGGDFRRRWGEIFRSQADARGDVNIIYLSAIATPLKLRCSGVGSELLQNIISFADRHGLDVVCEASTSDVAVWYANRKFSLVDISHLENNVSVHNMRYTSSR